MVFLGSRRIDLGAGFVIGHQAIQANPGQQGRLAVAFAFLVIKPPEPSCAVRLLPAEQRSHPERLRRMQHIGFALELPTVQPQHIGKEVDRPAGCRLVPHQPACLAVLQILQMAAAGIADMRTRHHFPGHHLFGPSRRRIKNTCLPGLRRPASARSGFGFAHSVSSQIQQQNGPCPPLPCWRSPPAGSGKCSHWRIW